MYLTKSYFFKFELLYSLLSYFLVFGFIVFYVFVYSYKDRILYTGLFYLIKPKKSIIIIVAVKVILL